MVVERLARDLPSHRLFADAVSTPRVPACRRHWFRAGLRRERPARLARTGLWLTSPAGGRGVAAARLPDKPGADDRRRWLDMLVGVEELGALFAVVRSVGRSIAKHFRKRGGRRMGHAAPLR